MKNSRYFHFIIAATLSILSGIASYYSVFKSADFYLYDLAHAFSDVVPAEDIIIVDIDEQSLATLGAWPWSRARHADLLDQLSVLGVDNVAFDVIFSELKNEDLTGDVAFAEAIARHSGVVLPVFIGQVGHKGAPVEVPPASLFYASEPSVGHVHIDCEYDSICRSVFLKEGVGKPYWSHLSLSLLQQQRFTRAISGTRVPPNEAKSSMLIYRDFENYILFPKAGVDFNTVSFLDVINGYFQANQFKGYTAFVGSTAAGLGDEISTPVGPMPGVMANATIYQQLRSESLVQQPSAITRGLLTAILGLVILLVISRMAPLYFLVSTLSLVVATYGLMIFSLVKLHYWLPFASLMLLILVYYPLWSWFKLQLALNFLRTQLGKLRYENLTSGGLFTESTKSPKKNKGGMTFGVEAVTNTLNQLDSLGGVLDEHRFLIENTLTHLQEAVLLAAADGRIVLANNEAKQCFAIKRDSTLNSLAERIDKLEHKSLTAWPQYTEALITGKHLGGIEIHLRPGDEENEHADNARVLYCKGALEQFDSGNDQSFKMLVLTFTDITPIKNIERSRLDTLNFLSHDLRAPMVSILALLNNIKSGKNADSTEANLETIRRYTENNLSYSESILQLSRAEALKQESFSFVDMHSVIDTAYCNANEFAKSKQITLTIDREDADFWAEGDAELLERAVQNLLSNAIKYSDERGQVVLTLRSRNDYVEIQVTDSGIGIDTAEVENIFSRYKRAGKSRANLGAGLGLFFVKTVVQKHGGTIGVESVLGEGTSFMIALPRCHQDLGQ
ncbi:MAG: CHASE2 domain-containing protein [Agarilytica sp.]